jgi:putative oxidoreductase
MTDQSLSHRLHVLGLTWSPYLLSLLRIIAAFTFMQAGSMKLFAYPMGMPAEVGPLVLLSQVGIGGILEFFGGALLLIGLWTRPAAFILSGEMAVAYFQFHAPNGFWPIVNGGIDAILYCFIFLYLSASGPGTWSLDAVLAKRRTVS